jgi:hypothetical protein
LELQGSTPDYDVLLTNPPYSGTHIEKLLKFTAGDLGSGKSTGRNSKTEHGRGSSKPFLLLLPHFVYTKDYYKNIYPSRMEDGSQNQFSSPFFLCPLSRYSYLPPQWVTHEGSKAIAKGKVRTAPFPSFWYCSGASERTQNDDLTLFLTRNFGKSGVFHGTRDKIKRRGRNMPVAPHTFQEKCGASWTKIRSDPTLALENECLPRKERMDQYDSRYFTL